MAVQRPYQEISGQNVNTLTLPTRPGSGRVVTRISVAGGTNAEFATIKNGPTTTGYFAVGDTTQNHLGVAPNNTQDMNVFDVLKSLGLPATIPVKEGDELTVSFATAATAVKIEYQDVDPADIKPTDPFGREATSGPMILYGTNNAAQAATGYTPINKSLMPVELTDFPWETNAEPGKNYAIYAYMANDLGVTTAVAGDNSLTTNQRITKNRETLYDPLQAGFVIRGDISSAGVAQTNTNSGINQVPMAGGGNDKMPAVLPTPTNIAPGDELLLEQAIEVQGAGAGVAADALTAAILVMVNPPATGGGGGQA